MPDSTITAPVAADPIERLTLGATDAREIAPVGASGTCFCAPLGTCMAEE
jgi:hypothetical protein